MKGNEVELWFLEQVLAGKELLQEQEDLDQRSEHVCVVVKAVGIFSVVVAKPDGEADVRSIRHALSLCSDCLASAKLSNVTLKSCVSGSKAK